MNKFKFLILLSILFSTLVKSQNKDYELCSLRIKNKITSETIYLTEYIQGKPIKKIIESISYYNTKGKESKYERYSNGKPFVTWKYFYDGNGNLIKELAYDNKMRVFNSLVFEYDSSGNQISRKQFDARGKMVVYQKREYNKKNENTKLYNPTDSTFKEFILEMEYFYNEESKWSKILTYSKYSTLPYSTELYQYNDNGNLVKISVINNNDTSVSCIYLYDDSKQLIEKNYPVEIEKIGTGKYMINTSAKKITYNYDKLGNLTEEKIFLENDLIEKREHLYVFK